jgi:hypothetical protein
MIYHLEKRVGPAPDIARGTSSVLTEDVLWKGRPNDEPLMLPNLANHSVKGFEDDEKVGLKLARTKSAEVFWRTAFSIWDREPA